MLTYEPKNITTPSSADRPQWAFTWSTGGLPEPGLLLKMIAVTRDSPIAVAKPEAVRQANTPFQPERMSGLCASS